MRTALRCRSCKRQRAVDVIQHIARDFDHLAIRTPHLERYSKTAVARGFGFENGVLVVDEVAPLNGRTLGQHC